MVKKMQMSSINAYFFYSLNSLKILQGVSANNYQLGSKQKSPNDWVHKHWATTSQGSIVNNLPLQSLIFKPVWLGPKSCVQPHQVLFLCSNVTSFRFPSHVHQTGMSPQAVWGNWETQGTFLFLSENTKCFTCDKTLHRAHLGIVDSSPKLQIETFDSRRQAHLDCFIT